MIILKKTYEYINYISNVQYMYLDIKTSFIGSYIFIGFKFRASQVHNIQMQPLLSKTEKSQLDSPHLCNVRFVWKNKIQQLQD